jgi:hypothetical protein
MTDSDNREPTRSGFGESARQRAIHAYDNARGEVAGAGRKAADSLSEAPLIALAGGLAAGALIAALLPRTAVETKALRPTVKRVRKTARAAVDAARETGSSRLTELGLTRDKGEQTIRSIFEGASDAVRASAKAAADVVRKQD